MMKGEGGEGGRERCVRGREDFVCERVLYSTIKCYVVWLL